MSKKNYQYMIIISSVVVLSLVLSACGPKEAPITVPAGAQAGDLVGLEPCTYKANKVEYDADCGTLVVPENRSDPSSRLIALAVIRVRALGDNPAEPIFRFEGGPGLSNTRFSHLEGLVDNHDIVLVGYRGMDASVVLQCPEVVQAMKGVGDDLLGKESIANIGDALTRCATRFQDEGVDLDGYTVPEVVEDAEAARVGLGYERINLLGNSYGTRVEMIYTWMHPESIHRVVMIAANPPGHFVWEPDAMDRLLEYDASLCAQDPECSARTDDLAETMRNVAHNMPRRWLFMPIDPGKVRMLTAAMNQSRVTGATAFDAFLAAEGGDPSGLAIMSLMYDFMFPSALTWGYATALAGSADFDPTRDYLTEMNPPGSIIGTPYSELLWSSAQFADWPMAPIPEEFRQVQPSEVETLVVSGSADYAIPQWFATEELLPALSNGQQVILSEFAHTDDVYTLQPEARVRLLTTFFDTGEVDDSLFTYQPMDFSVGLGFPAMAKLLVAIVVMVPLGLVALVWFIARRVRRRRAA